MKKMLNTALWLCICMLVVQPIAAGSEEIVRQGAYTLQRSSAPEKWVIGITATELVRTHFPGMTISNERFLGREGRGMTLYREDDNQVVKLTLAVYGTTTEAEDTALITLKKAAANLPAGSKNGRTIGTHSWYEIAQDGRGVVLVVYYNVFFKISATSYSLAEEQAIKIVEDLKQGKNGVRLGNKVKPPKADEIKLRLKPHGGGLWQVSHKPASGKKKILYRVFPSRGSMLRTGEEGQSLYRPTKSGTVAFTVYAMDDLNVVSSAHTEEKEVE